ncbi:hypothetical protein ACFUNF_04940 [Streptomyces sp. NPDC057291]|uniref:hypothetical protein n=1 Tax=Streptomyces sp. NPDC057291 TaxID=3346087 RepID=UPI003631FAC2
MAIDICTDPPCTLTHTHERQAIDYPTDTPRGPPTHKTITGLVLLGLVSVRCDDTSDQRIARLVKADEDTVHDAIHRVNEIGATQTRPHPQREGHPLGTPRRRRLTGQSGKPEPVSLAE